MAFRTTLRPWRRWPEALLHARGLSLALALVACALCGILSYHFAYTGYAQSQMTAASRSLASVSAALSSLLNRHESLPRMLALDTRLVSAVGDPHNREAVSAANLYLADIARQGRLMAAYLTDDRGTTIAASNWDQPASFVGKNYAFRPYFKDAMAGGIGRFYAVGATSGEPGYFLATRLRTPAGTQGVVVVKVALEATLKASDGHGADVVAVVDEFGVIFLSSNPPLLYRPVEPPTGADLATLQATRRYADQLGPPLHSGRPREGDPEVQPVWHPIDGPGWRVVSFQDLRPARWAGWLGALAGVLAAGLALALAMFIWLRRIRAAEIERSRDQLSRSEERLRAVVDNLPVMVCFVSHAERYVFANALYAQQYGCSARELEGKGIWEVLDPEEYEATQPHMKRAQAGETVVFEREYRNMRQYRCFEATYRPEWNPQKTAVTGVHVMTQDITQTRQRLQDLARLSQLDHLTQLMNRKGFEARLDDALAGASTEGAQLALLFIDLDGFKPINDTHGHAVGDAVLVAFGQRVSRLVRSDDVVARLGGDEFAVLLPAIAHLSVAERVADAIVKLAQRPFSVEGGLTVHIGASVGVAYLAHGSSCSAQALCRSADASLYDAKRRGRRTFVVGEALADAPPDHAEERPRGLPH